MILDIHTHKKPPYPSGVVSLGSFDAPLMKRQLYSAGIHPWDTIEEITESTFQRLETLASDSRVAAIGECGVDLLKGGALYRQLNILRRQIEISERVRKPVILHCVRAADIIMGLKRDLNPTQPWVVHGFRGKPELASQLTAKGIYLSFGEKFNAGSVAGMPLDRILAETDDSILSITQIIGMLSEAADRDLTASIQGNTAAVLGLG